MMHDDELNNSKKLKRTTYSGAASARSTHPDTSSRCQPNLNFFTV
jgi:hypothetical protein